eukprot:m.341530 g.341530  ORF g.341530 m.341530 type:complete len:449 (+) comp20169_c0_seq1:208-1554(+)
MSEDSLERTVLANPKLFTSWEEEADEHPVCWWELFVDLVLALSCSVLSDTLNDDLNGANFGAFILLFTLFLSGVNEYGAFNSRFMDLSLQHSATLLLFLLGTAGMAANSYNFEYVQAFCLAVAIQRGALLLMEVSVYWKIPVTRNMLRQGIVFFALDVACGIVGYFTNHNIAIAMLATIAINGICTRFVVAITKIACFGQDMKKNFIPVHVDHSNERKGCVVMVILGESVVSSVLNYHVRRKTVIVKDEYLGALALTMLLLFCLGLIYYGVNPPRELHALKRGRVPALTFLLVHYCLFWSLLLIGVGIKQIMDVVFNEKDHIPFDHTILIFCAMSATLFSNLVLRLTHFAGRGSEGESYMHRMISLIWWCTFFLQCLFPAGCAVATAIWYPHGMPPFLVLGLLAGNVTTQVVLESCIIEYLMKTGYVPYHKRKTGTDEEHRGLIQDNE